MVLLPEKEANRDIQRIGNAIQDLKRRISLSSFNLGKACFRDASLFGEGSQ
jgi:predicted metal-binding protein